MGQSVLWIIAAVYFGLLAMVLLVVGVSIGILWAVTKFIVSKFTGLDISE